MNTVGSKDRRPDPRLQIEPSLEDWLAADSSENDCTSTSLRIQVNRVPAVGHTRTDRNSGDDKSGGVRRLCSDPGPEWHDMSRGVSPWVSNMGRAAGAPEALLNLNSSKAIQRG